MEDYIENFEKVWNDNRRKILNLEIENLKSILSSDKLKNCSQQTVWQVIHDWVIVNKEDRLTHLPNLLKESLQFDRLTKQFVNEIIFKNVIFLLLPLNFQTNLKSFVKHVNFQTELNNGSFNLPNLSPVINYYHQKLLCINAYDGYLEIYDQQHNNWHSSPVSLEFLKKQQFFVKFALLGNMLYAFGGNSEKKVTNKMWSRDLSDPSSQWTARANMKQSRKWFCSVVLNDTIYAFGGEDENYQPLRSCERYDSQLNEWSTVADINCDSRAASAAVINGCIYVAGGGNEKKVLKSVSKYCPETDTWREVAPMTTQRYLFALTPFAGRLWAIGGGGYINQPLCSCESYDPVNDTWRKEAPMKGVRSGHTAIEFNGELLVVAGGNKIEKENETLQVADPVLIVEKYLPNKGWIRSGTIQNNILYAKLIIVPSVCSNIFIADSK